MRVCAHCGSQVPADANFCPACGQPPAGQGQPPPGPGQARRKPSRGASGSVLIAVVVGCGLVAVMFFGIVAAIFIPNFLDALHKGRQKRTTVDLREAGNAIQAYWTDYDTLPPMDSPDALAQALEPEYVSELRRVDGWGHPLRFECWGEPGSGETCDRFGIASPGRDGVFQHPDLSAYEPGTFAPTDYDQDIVWSDGVFLRAPGRLAAEAAR